MANALNINSAIEANQKVNRGFASSAIGSTGSFNASPGSTVGKTSKTYDYSAIKLTDRDKYYRMEIKKQSDSLLKAAEAITSKFPPLFEQLTKGLNNIQNDIKAYVDSKVANKSDDKKILEEQDQQNEDQAKASNETNESRAKELSESKTKPMFVNEKRLSDNENSTHNVEGISKAITNFIDNINGLSNKAKESGSYTAQSTVKQMTAAFKDFEGSLAEIGITAGGSDDIKVDKNMLDSSIKNGSAKSVLTAENGFTERMAKIAKEAGKHSDNFIEKTNTNMNSRPTRNTSINYNYMTNVSIDN